MIAVPTFHPPFPQLRSSYDRSGGLMDYGEWDGTTSEPSHGRKDKEETHSHGPILSIARPSHENDDYIYLRWPQRPRFLGEREGGKRDRDAAVTPSISERSEVGSVRVPRRWLTSLPLLLSHEIDGVRKEKERLTAAKGTRR